jgi:putative nucleotidyltransferase with HDIG domain
MPDKCWRHSARWSRRGDPYTAGHRARVAELAVCIARELGLDDGRVQGLRLAALVHDVGKIVIPSSLLMKPTPLTDLERELMCTHVAAGVSVLDGIDFPWPVVRMVEQHHERIDGSGYPYGIGDAELLFESKILGVADTLEAFDQSPTVPPRHFFAGGTGPVESPK